MSKQEIEIIKRLSSVSAEPSPHFKKKLLSEIMSLQVVEKKENTFMFNMKFVYALSFALVAVVGFGAFKLIDSDDQAQVALTSDESPVDESVKMDASFASSLPSVTLETIEDAKAAVSFDIYEPSVKIGDEKISSIEKIDSMLGDGQDSIAIKYADDSGTLYRINQSTFFGAPAEDFEQVKINFLGKEYTARYTQLTSLEEQDENSESFVYGDSVPTSYLAWETDDVSYEISEFGRVSQEQLVSLANSMR